jgi:hypothetical protein
MKPLQWAVIAFGLADLVLTLGYFAEAPWALSTWPWQDLQSIDYLLVSSFLAGATGVILWLGFTGEWGAAAGATMNVGLMNAGAAAYLYRLGFHSRALTFTLFALINMGVLVWSLRHPIRDRRPIDWFLRGSFFIFTAVLLFAAVQLFRRSPTIFPWRIEPDAEIMVGWLFLGSAVYFGWGFLRPSWHNARGQLIAFLAYDLVLFPRYVLMFSTVNPEHLPSLIAYVAVLSYSSLLAVYYLFIHPRTRSWAIDVSG